METATNSEIGAWRVDGARGQIVLRKGEMIEMGQWHGSPQAERRRRFWRENNFHQSGPYGKGRDYVLTGLWDQQEQIARLIPLLHPGTAPVIRAAALARYEKLWGEPYRENGGGQAPS